MANLVFIGDSLIEYFDWADRFAEHRVSNLGRSGETVEELLARLPAVAQRPGEPDFIFIMSGTNNVAMEDGGFLAPYREIIGRLQTAFPAARIVIHSLPPIILPWFNPALVDQANAQIRKLARETGVGFIDLNATFEQAGAGHCLVADGVHISDHGYHLWSTAVGEAISGN